MIAFPLYHGTSSHYLGAFRHGTAPGGWPYRDAALALFTNTWTALRGHGIEPEWHIERMLSQTNGHANWQHGELYVTPSLQSAVRYASSGAAFGGELLNECRGALDRLAETNRAEAERLLQDAGPLVRLLNGGGTPILVEIGNVFPADLLPERAMDDVEKSLEELSAFDVRMREVVGQQMNFRLAPAAGIVASVFHLHIADTDDPLSAFTATEIAATAS